MAVAIDKKYCHWLLTWAAPIHQRAGKLTANQKAGEGEKKPTANEKAEKGATKIVSCFFKREIACGYPMENLS